MLSPLAFPVSPHPPAGDVQFLEDQINAFNVARTGIEDGGLLSIFVRDDSGAMLAGLYGWTWGGACEIRFLLWVREDVRGQGYGARLLKAAEQEALARGCRTVVLSTHTFQAPGFYQKFGYQVAGAFEAYPRGHRQLFLQKTL
jgi:GNAT superfamily N-acetyltransferase